MHDVAVDHEVDRPVVQIDGINIRNLRTFDPQAGAAVVRNYLQAAGRQARREPKIDDFDGQNSVADRSSHRVEIVWSRRSR